MSRYYCETVTRYQVIDGETGRVVGSYVTEEMAKEVRSALNEKEIADEHFAGKASPQDTETDPDDASDEGFFVKNLDECSGSEPVQPMADLSGVDYAPAFEGYQPNGSLPETD